MKTIYLSVILILGTLGVQSQICISDSYRSPNGSAMLEVYSNTKGFLPPRMTEAQRNAVSSPATGLMVYQTDNQSGLYYYTGTTWISFNALQNNWQTNGNSGISDNSNFLGTIDNVPLKFKCYDTICGLINASKNNAFLGLFSGARTIYGGSNSLFGFANMVKEENFSYSIAVGANAARNCTSSNYTLATGSDALRYNQTANGNIAVGYKAMFNNTYSQYNIAIGNKALYNNSYNNSENSWDTRNTAIGNCALYHNNPDDVDNGIYNLAVGDSALFGNITGKNNIAIGFGSMYENHQGAYCIGLGYNALENHVTGRYDIGIGYKTLSTDIGGTNNVAAGYLASNFGSGIETGSYNVTIGYYTFVPGSSRVNCIDISGYFSLNPSQDSTARFGQSTTTSIGGQVAWTTLSDKRVKENIKHDVPGLDFILKLNPVTYHFDIKKQNEMISAGYNDIHPEMTAKAESIVHSGFIAQEVKRAAEECNYGFEGVDVPDKESDIMGLRYALFTVPLVKAVQEQNKILNDMQKELENLSEQTKSIDLLQNEIEQLKSDMFKK